MQHEEILGSREPCSRTTQHICGSDDLGFYFAVEINILGNDGLRAGGLLVF